MIIRRVWPRAVMRANSAERPLFSSVPACALEPDLGAVSDGDHVPAAEAVGGGALGALDEIDGTLVLALGQEGVR